MAMIPAAVKEAWARRQGAVILATTDGNGLPNVIYVTCVSLYGEEWLVVADNYFDKTRKNIVAGSKGAALFMTKEGKPYQFKGSLEYHKAGPLFADMKQWNPPTHPGHAAVALLVEEIYSGSERIEV